MEENKAQIITGGEDSNSPVTELPPAVEPVAVEEKKPDEINDASSLEKNGVNLPVSGEEVFYMSTQEDGATLTSSITNMMNSIIGAGVLSIPNTVRKAGLLGSFILLFVCLYLSLEGAHMLSDVSVYTKQDSYGTVATRLGIPKVGFIGDVAMIVFDLGVSVAYLIIFFQKLLIINLSFRRPIEYFNKFCPKSRKINSKKIL